MDERPPEEIEQQRIEDQYFHQKPQEDIINFEEVYPPVLDNNSLHSFILRLAASSEIRNYIFSTVQKEGKGIDIRQPRSSKAGILVDFNSAESYTVTLSPAMEEIIPTIPYKEAAVMIDNAFFTEKRSFKQTWLHSKRTKESWSIPDRLTKEQICFLASLAAYSKSLDNKDVPLKDWSNWPQVRRFLKSSDLAPKSDKQRGIKSPDDDSEIPF